MINALIITFFLVMTGTAYMMWAVGENHQGRMDLARTQAYYVAQYGVLNRGLTELRTRQIETLPPDREHLPSGKFYSGRQDELGVYTDTYIERVSGIDQDIYMQQLEYKVWSTGHVELKDQGMVRDVTRTINMVFRLRSYSAYMYLTNYEMTMFDEIIWFYTDDTLHGRVHSNSQIGIKQRPVFYGPVSTCADDFIHGPGYNPYFAHEPQFNAQKVFFPTTAEKIRTGASSGGCFFDNDNGRLQSRLTGQNGAWVLEQWTQGTPYNEQHIAVFQTIGMPANIFIEGDVELSGTVTGIQTIGCSGDLRLIDNIYYADVSPNNPGGSDRWLSYNGSSHLLGLISEQRIVIQDTNENGHGNSMNGSDITITAALVALGESFTFQHQNDEWDTYQWCADGINGQDERGDIRLRGSVTQVRRGYVHRSNCGGTGYWKDYLYDRRLDRTPPPCYLDAVDEEGYALFDPIYWAEDASFIVN